MKTLLNVALSLLPLLLTSLTFADRRPKGKPAPEAAFVLAVQDNLVSLTVRNASLKGCLEQTGPRMNIEVLALLPEREKTTTEFEKLPLR